MPVPLSVVVEQLRAAGYVIYAPGAEADRARSDAEIARLTVEAERCSRGGCRIEQEGEAIDARDAAASARVDADDASKERGVAGARCEAGNECGSVGCPECQQ